jgi:hypothetical protein
MTKHRVQMTIAKPIRCFRFVITAAALLSACAGRPPSEPAYGPYSFHDTRLQIALLTDDRKALQSEFAMTTEPTWSERLAAVFVLPVSAATETASWPVAAAFRAYHESH